MRSSVPVEQMVAIDRSGLRQEAEHRHGKLAHKETETPMARHLKALIRVCPIPPSHLPWNDTICSVRSAAKTEQCNDQSLVLS